MNRSARKAGVFAHFNPIPLFATILVVGGLIPTGVSAQQAPLPAAQAADFMGRWNVAIESDFGPFEVVLHIQDSQGRTVASVGTPQGDATVTEISRSGEQLVLRYAFDGPDGALPIVVNLRRDGENLRTTMDVGGGLFTASGTGRRATQ